MSTSRTAVASLTSLLLLLLACVEAGLVFERVGETAKDVGERIETGVRNVLHRPRDHTVVPPAVIATSPTTNAYTTEKLADKAAAAEEQGRSFIDASRRCPPGETLTMDECRPSLDF